MWHAALAGRFAYVTHRFRGHLTIWKRSRADRSPCPGDVVCETCNQVLWCRAHDPWRRIGTDVPPDHWGATRGAERPPTLFDHLQQVLRLAGEWPSGRSGDAIRRAACELTEASSLGQRHVHRQRMLKIVTRTESRLPHRSGDNDPSPRLLRALREVLSRDFRA